jgi:amidase
MRIHSFTNDILAERDAVELASLIRSKEIQSKEVVAACIQRAQQVEPEINAIVTNCFAKGLTESEHPSPGFFSGVPIFFKDLTQVKGMPNYYGSQAFVDAKAATQTDPIAKQILAQGFVNLGTSSMPEFGFTCSTEFPHQKDTCNPWNTLHTAGGSSGGAGALVAAGVLPIAHSADGGGSTRVPASSCGLVGLKPTRGRLCYSKLFEKQIVEISTDGVITRSVRDTAYFYAEAEKFYHNKRLAPIGLVQAPNKKKLRIGFTGTSLKELKADAVTLAELNKTAILLESLGHEVRPVDLPISEQLMDDFKNLWAMSAFFCRHFGKQLFGKHYKPENLTQLTNGLAQHYWKNKFATPFFIKRLNKCSSDYQHMMDNLQLDILLTPTTAHAAPPLGYMSMNLSFDEIFPRIMQWTCFTPYANATGAPSISLPLGFDEAQGLPLGMLFGAKQGEEKLLLELALQIEEAQPWRKINVG